MNRDTDFTIKDILDGAPLVELVQEYSKIVSEPDTSAILKSLRFIRIPPNFRESNEGDLLFEIIGSEDYPEGADYIAVSYCWNSFIKEDENNLTISVLDRGITRKPRCSKQVLLRAASYAARTSVSLIWIDQECIDQTDHDDVQKHIQCMHHIYRDAKACIGLLNFEIFNERQVIALADFSSFDPAADGVWADVKPRPEYLVDVDMIEFFSSFLTSIHKDPWFSRTWVFQERLSGSLNMRLLFTISSKLMDQLLEKDIGLYYYAAKVLNLSLRSLVHNPASWLLALRKFDLENPGLRAALENLHAAARRINARLQGFSIDECINIQVLERKITQRDFPMDGNHFKARFHSIEACDNQIVSDRVAIFSNVAQLSHRIDTLGLGSYSMSLLTLLIANGYLPRILFTADMGNDNSHHLLVQFPLIGDLHAWFRKLVELLSNEKDEDPRDHSLYKDLLAMTQVLFESDPEALSQIADLQEELEARLRNNVTGPLKCIPIIPMSATIQHIIDGIIRVSSEKRAHLTHIHGRRILQYAIKTGQAPEDAEFVAFYSDFCWRAEFVEKFFGTEDADIEDTSNKDVT